jgi:two-component system sensor histidine kinase KdpD
VAGGKVDAGRIRPYAMSIGLVALTTLLGELVKETLEPTNLVIFYLLVVVIAAVRWGKGPAIMTSILGVLAFDFFLVPPYLTFNVASIHYVFTFIGLLVVGLVISTLASRMREQTIQARRREGQTAALYHLSTDLADADTYENALQAIRKNVGAIFDADVAIFLPTEKRLGPISVDPGFPMNETELLRAQRVFETDESSRRRAGQDESPGPRYAPFNTPQGVLGVLGINLRETGADFADDEESLFNALVNQAAVAIQRARLAEEARQVELIRQKEKLQSALLSSISHDLRTPLASITGTLTTLIDQSAELDSPGQRELLGTARGEADRLNRLVGNLLDMTRVEAQALGIKKRMSDLRDVIWTSLEQFREAIGSRTIRITIPPGFPEVPMDVSFMMKVFTNLVDNALKFSPADSPIEITARLSDGSALVEIKDQGIGIPGSDFERVFEKFYHAERPPRGAGTGLGLSICKGIVEAHGGTIMAMNNDDGGATFTVALPLD